jgi:hypothetical protein
MRQMFTVWDLVRFIGVSVLLVRLATFGHL